MPTEHEHRSVHRRDVICGGGLAAFGAMLSALLGGARPVRAAGVTGAVPEIDSLAVRVVIDSYQFAVAPSTKVGNVDIQRFGWGIGSGKPDCQRHQKHPRIFRPKFINSPRCTRGQPDHSMTAAASLRHFGGCDDSHERQADEVDGL